MTAKQFFDAAQLAEAVAAAVDDVKKRPTDESCRWFLCELLCFVGELDRADKQLDLIASQDPQAVAGVSLFRQLVRAELARREVFREGRVPEFLGAPDPILRAHVAALIELRSGHQARAGEILAQARDQIHPAPGVCDGTPFDEIRDLDDVCAPFLEVLTSTGKYYWVPLSTIASLEFRPPKRARDLLWRQADLSVNGGPNGEVYVPCLYAGTVDSSDQQLKLGRATDWIGEDPVRGVGQRMLLVGETDKSILEITNIEFTASRNIGDAPPPAPPAPA
jgi:type VI secretion system protein ImpE